MTEGADIRQAHGSRRVALDNLFLALCLLATSISVLALGVLITSVIVQGHGHLDLSFLQSPPSRKPEKAGLMPAMWGSVFICTICAVSAMPLGVGTAVLLEEFRPRRRLLRKAHAFIELNIRNLAGVPSIVYGIVGLTAFVQLFGVGNASEPFLTFPLIGTEAGTPEYSERLAELREKWYFLQLPFGRGVIAGGLTLMLVVLPIVIISTQEALRAVPNSLREGVLAVGATRWQSVSKMTLPSAIPGIMTGAILALSRAIGEAAPILVIGGILFIRFRPLNLMDDFTAMPLQIYDWAGRPQEEFHAVAAAGIIVLLGVLLAFNAVAVFIRQRFHARST